MTTATLSWVDVLAGEFHRATWDGDGVALVNHVVQRHDTFATFREIGPHGEVSCLRDEIRWPGDRTPTIVEMPEGHRFNDGRVDAEGRLLIGTMELNGQRGVGSLWLAQPKKPAVQLRSNTTIANGLRFNAAGDTMYWVDSGDEALYVFDYNSGLESLPQPRQTWSFADIDGTPDGIDIDQAGHLWIALYGGGAVIELNPATGEALTRVEVGATQPTACALGGSDSRTLFITSAAKELIDPTPGLDGALHTAYVG
ncbi:SMP-30/gluconolactonase/LRE family protein [Ornithinimicrobium sp. Arc0846-15]|nr:SMP-30/gluconolactonase/LRE family protein [Ornithinimicrobium laminariae]